ncbi:MAG: YkgJ family cysteine cluster protein [Nitrospirota bacterium]|nr:MAG: YkgJ family cysteine cluster protein [Nitrospirota bacterium]
MDVDVAQYLGRLAKIYGEIGQEYDKAAGKYGGFSCEGCTDNCCTTVFHHHTLIENLYLIEGFEGLDVKKKEEAVIRAKKYVEELSDHPFDMTELSIMCPLNVEGKCEAYEYRPLICRIHGMPGILHSPKGTKEFDGCPVFMEQHGNSISHRIDRTSFYTDIAFIERDLREEMVFTEKHRKTIAEMIVDYTRDEITLSKRLRPEDFHKDSHII